MENLNIEEYIKDLSPELKEKARACASVEELLKLARENKVPLPDDALEAVAGGKGGGNSEFKPNDEFHIFREDVGARVENDILYLYTVQWKGRAWVKLYILDECHTIAGQGGDDLGINIHQMLKLCKDPRALQPGGYKILRKDI